jgi:hypothetical protein
MEDDFAVGLDVAELQGTFGGIEFFESVEMHDDRRRPVFVEVLSLNTDPYPGLSWGEICPTRG